MCVEITIESSQNDFVLYSVLNIALTTWRGAAFILSVYPFGDIILWRVFQSLTQLIC